MFPEWTMVVGLWLGATIGSFLNVVVYRMPRGLSLGDPKNSFCPSCKHQLGVADLVPLLSWLAQRGRCRYCGARISPRYFVVELITGIIWAAIWWQYFVAGRDPAKAIAYGAASAALVAIIFIDLEFYIIPDQVNAFLLFVGLSYNGYLYYAHAPNAATWGIPSSVLGWVAGVGIIWLITLFGRIAFGKDAMGHGDIKMARGIGAVLFAPVALISFGLAVALGAVLGIVQVLARSAKERHATGGADLADEEPSSVGEDETPPYQPESIGSILKCGLGYLLCIDVIGLFYLKLYLAWFGENPFEPVIDAEGEQTDFEIEPTMIPFGPYLALGAIVATVFETQLRVGVENYWRWAAGGPAMWEHLLR